MRVKVVRERDRLAVRPSILVALMAVLATLVCATSPASAKVERYRVGGSPLALERLGTKGPPIVFVPGMGEDSRS